MSTNISQSNILLCGSSRVGKSTLINAICQQKLAKSSESLNSVTNQIERYSYEYSKGGITHRTVIWDTPGIESWNENQVRSYVSSLINQIQPLCMIYCASPGSFAGLEHLKWLVAECYRQKIFCALVCTNMWSGKNRQEVLIEFSTILNSVHPNIEPTNEDGLFYYDRVALTTMVNSEEYIDQDFDVRKPPSGVEELIFGIAKSLNRDLMFAWFRSVAQNKSFWSKMSSKLNGLFKIPAENLTSLCGHAAYYLQLIFDPADISVEYPQSIDKKNNFSLMRINDNELLFHDAVMIDHPDRREQTKLIFTFRSEDRQTTGQLSKTLSELGAISCKTEQSNNDDKNQFSIIAEFENNDHTDAILNLCQLIDNNQINCTLANK